MRFVSAFSAAALFLAAGQVRADYQFQFATAAGTATNTFAIDYSVQTFVDIRVYLQATGTTDINTLRNDGLKTFGVKLNYSGTEAQVLNDAAITSNAAFDDAEFKDVTPTSAAVNDQVLNVSPTVKAGATEDRILLGTFRFTGLADGTMASVTIDPDPTPGVDDTVTGGNAVLDALINNSTAQITVTNVPEPGTLILTGMCALGLIGAGVRRLRGPTPLAV